MTTQKENVSHLSLSPFPPNESSLLLSQQVPYTGIYIDLVLRFLLVVTIPYIPAPQLLAVLNPKFKIVVLLQKVFGNMDLFPAKLFFLQEQLFCFISF